jgi:aspartyl-tRNA(Asn)/glutamyl-tRNA(Gln) amidotransferase subunit B
MITEDVRKRYQVTIGIECHVQLKTDTKLFSAVGNDARAAPPNTLVSHIDFALPGALPVLNEAAVRLAAHAAFALNSTPQKFSKFDRKHYFYPDLPMGYQITQFDQPIVVGGSVDITVDGEKKTIGITRAHLEADAGKSTHPAGADYSLVDLNRAGTPLLEIVSEPDMHSAAEAKAYAHELYLRMKYAGVSDANLYYGNMRFDVNVSVSTTATLGTRSETKNLNSFRSVEKAVEYETERQIERLEKGEAIVQETRGWDDAKQKTVSQRSKEDAHDYRYMPDPDIPPVVLDDAYIADIQEKLAMMPDEIRSHLSTVQISPEVIEDILDRSELTPHILHIIEQTSPEKARGAIFRLIKAPEDLTINVSEQVVSSEIIIANMVAAGELSSTAAQQVSEEALRSKEDPKVIAEKLNLIQVSNEAEIAQVVSEVLAANDKAAADVTNGEMKAIGFLVGQVMKASKGKANPELAQTLIKKQLGI